MIARHNSLLDSSPGWADSHTVSEATLCSRGSGTFWNALCGTHLFPFTSFSYTELLWARRWIFTKTNWLECNIIYLSTYIIWKTSHVRCWFVLLPRAKNTGISQQIKWMRQLDNMTQSDCTINFAREARRSWIMRYLSVSLGCTCFLPSSITLECKRRLLYL